MNVESMLYHTLPYLVSGRSGMRRKCSRSVAESEAHEKLQANRKKQRAAKKRDRKLACR